MMILLFFYRFSFVYSGFLALIVFFSLVNRKVEN